MLVRKICLLLFFQKTVKKNIFFEPKTCISHYLWSARSALRSLAAFLEEDFGYIICPTLCLRPIVTEEIGQVECTPSKWIYRTMLPYTSSQLMGCDVSCYVNIAVAGGLLVYLLFVRYMETCLP